MPRLSGGRLEICDFENILTADVEEVIMLTKLLHQAAQGFGVA